MSNTAAALACAIFGAAMLVLTYVFAWQTGTVTIAAIFTLAGAIVAAIIALKLLPPRRGGGRR